jgi:two-component system, chemotaxis family, CheB/CheR fusion protein
MILIILFIQINKMGILCNQANTSFTKWRINLSGKKIKPESRIKKSSDQQVNGFPVAGIGASAGGLDAISGIVKDLSSISGIAFVIIQHLDPNHPSNMVDLVRRVTTMAVDEIKDGMKVEPDRVYITPPNKNINISDYTLHLIEQPERPGISHNIDTFFKSLAEDLKDKSVCIVLSGTGTDGTIGAKAVKAEGGIVIVQDPETAKYDWMPNSAISAGVADVILSPEKIAEYLGSYIENIGKLADLKLKLPSMGDDPLKQILLLINDRTKQDFLSYKPSTLRRRIKRRMVLNGIEDIGEYLNFLNSSMPEVDALVKDFLINVTSFFRDPAAFKALKKAFKGYISQKPDINEIRAWVPGCSSGEEAYSVAIIIEEVLNELGLRKNVQVFATDLDKEAIVTARAGTYPSGIENDLSKKMLEKYFIKQDQYYRIKRELREKVVFSVQNVIKEPPFINMDLLSIRNLLIYLESAVKKKMMSLFHYSLKEDGILFLGTAETVGEFSEYFDVIDNKWKIYRSKKTNHKGTLYNLLKKEVWKMPSKAMIEKNKPGLQDVSDEPSYEHRLLEALPPALLLDDSYNLIFTHGNTSKYLLMPEGRPNFNIFDIIRPELKSSLSVGIHEATSTKKIFEKEIRGVKINDHTETIKLSIIPLIEENKMSVSNIIVTFPKVAKTKKEKKQFGTKETATEELQKELDFTRKSLRKTVEELETVNEELLSSNEEYQSTNEELQSTNEELETSREELQSLNEELSTINSQYQKKIEALAEVNDDMKNLLSATGVATVFLDTDLILQRFTPAAMEIFNFKEPDIGRPVSDITHNIKSIDLISKVKNVLDTLEPVKMNVKTLSGKVYSLRINPFRTTEHAVAGAGITLIDIGGRELSEICHFLNLTFETSEDPGVILGEDFNVILANRAFYKLFDLDMNTVKDKNFFKLDPDSWDIPRLKKNLEDILEKGTTVKDLKLDYKKEGKKVSGLLISGRRIDDKEEKAYAIYLSFTRLADA